MAMSVGLLSLFLFLPGCNSLKEKRSRIKPIISRLHKEFNVSVAEIDRLDAWHESVIGCAWISNDRSVALSSLEKVVDFVETHFPGVDLFDERYEVF